MFLQNLFSSKKYVRTWIGEINNVSDSCKHTIDYYERNTSYFSEDEITGLRQEIEWQTDICREIDCKHSLKVMQDFKEEFIKKIDFFVIRRKHGANQ